jgi:hypothetical protein
MEFKVAGYQDITPATNILSQDPKKILVIIKRFN